MHTCPDTTCAKSFRKASLLEQHMKHYHPKLKVEPKDSSRSASFSHSSDALDASARRKKRRTHSLSTGAAANSLPLGGVDFGAADDPLEPDSVTQCLCGHLDESEYMIQCERCHAWQHGECVGISQEDVPEQYLCYGKSDHSALVAHTRHATTTTLFVFFCRRCLCVHSARRKSAASQQTCHQHSTKPPPTRPC